MQMAGLPAEMTYRQFKLCRILGFCLRSQAESKQNNSHLSAAHLVRLAPHFGQKEDLTLHCEPGVSSSAWSTPERLPRRTGYLALVQDGVHPRAPQYHSAPSHCRYLWPSQLTQFQYSLLTNSNRPLSWGMDKYRGQHPRKTDRSLTTNHHYVCRSSARPPRASPAA